VLTPSRQGLIAECHRTRHQSSKSGLSQHIYPHLTPTLLPCNSHRAYSINGDLWIAATGQASTFRKNDGLYTVPVTGPERGYLRQLLSGVPGGAIANLTCTPNDRTLFCAGQHAGAGATVDDPPSTWPERAIPPRLSVIAVEKTEGSRVIGS
jgi:uncharacterized protein